MLNADGKSAAKTSPKDLHNLSIEYLCSECKVLMTRVPEGTALLAQLFDSFPHRCSQMYSCTFIALDKFIDLDSSKLSSICWLPLYDISCRPCSLTHRILPRLCLSSQKHFASAVGLKVKEGQRQQHNKPSTPKQEGREEKKKTREENLTHNLRAHAACQIVWLNTWLARKMWVLRHKVYAITAHRRATYMRTHTHTHTHA